MEQQNNKKTVIVVMLIIIILVLAFISYRLLQVGSEEAARQAILEAEVNKLNPFNKRGAVNPFEESSNPYDNIKTNPFE